MKLNFFILIFVITSCHPQKVDFSGAEVKREFENQPLKQKAGAFLIKNLQGNYSFDTTTLRLYRPVIGYSNNFDNIPFYQQNYQALIDSLWKQTVKNYPLFTKIFARPKLYDEQNITSEYLIENINRAFAFWENCTFYKSIPFDDFCRYILPYRKNQGLALEKWWYYEGLNDSLLRNKIRNLTIWQTIDTLMHSTDPIKYTNGALANYPYLKISDLLFSRQSECLPKCIYNTMLFSSYGIPVAIDFVPAWGKRNGNHKWNALVYKNKTYPFEPYSREDLWEYRAINENDLDGNAGGFYRLPKVYRVTYESYPEGPATDRKVYKADIPDLFLDFKKKDVTSEYFKPVDMKLTMPYLPDSVRYAYLCVFDRNRLIPVQWGKVKRKNSMFKGMGTGIVYVPTYCINKQLIPTGDAFFLSKNEEIEYFVPGKQKTSVTLERKSTLSNEVSRWPENSIGGKFQGSNDASFNKVADLYTITETPKLYFQDFKVDSHDKFRYVRFLFGKGKNGNLAELKFKTTENDKIVDLKGIPFTSIGMDTSYLYNVCDGNNLTYISEIEADSTKSYWIGFDFGEKTKITSIGFCPRNDANNIFPGLTYELFYWDRGWNSVGKQITTSHTIDFENVPENSILLLRCLDEGVEERIFTYENGKQIWR